MEIIHDAVDITAKNARELSDLINSRLSIGQKIVYFTDRWVIFQGKIIQSSDWYPTQPDR